MERIICYKLSNGEIIQDESEAIKKQKQIQMVSA